jgi:hypothetical protein
MLPERLQVAPLGSPEPRSLQQVLGPLVEVVAGQELDYPSARPASGSQVPRRSGFSSTEHMTCSDLVDTDACASAADAVEQEGYSLVATSAHADSSSRAAWCRLAWR